MSDPPPKRLESRLSGFFSRLSFSKGPSTPAPAPVAETPAPEPVKEAPKDAEGERRKLGFRSIGKSSGSLMPRHEAPLRSSTDALDIAVPKASPSTGAARSGLGHSPKKAPPSPKKPTPPPAILAPPPADAPPAAAHDALALMKTASMEISPPPPPLHLDTSAILSTSPSVPPGSAPLSASQSRERSVQTSAHSAPSSARSANKEMEESLPEEGDDLSSVGDPIPLQSSNSEGTLHQRLFATDRLAGVDSSDTPSASSRSSPNSDRVLHPLKPAAKQMFRSSSSDFKASAAVSVERVPVKPPPRQKSLESLSTISKGSTRRSKDRRRHNQSASTGEKKSSGESSATSASGERPKLVKKGSTKAIRTLDRNFRTLATMSLTISASPPQPRRRPSRSKTGDATATQLSSASSDPINSDDENTLAVNLTASRSHSPPSSGSRGSRGSRRGSNHSLVFGGGPSAAQGQAPLEASRSLTSEEFEGLDADSAFPSTPVSMVLVQELCNNPNQLLEALLSRDHSFISLLADVLDVNTFERVSKSLLVVFEASGRTLHLLRWAVTREMGHTASSTTLFREDGLTCRLLSLFSRQAGMTYLRAVLSPLVRKVAQSSTNYEADPKRAEKKSEKEIRTNLRHLRKLTEKFLSAILDSAQQCPRPLRVLYSLLMSRCPRRFPEMAPHVGVGALFFLRFLCPALVDPLGWGLLEKQPGERGKRGLILVAKVLQNLANGVEFGEKESFLIELNDLIAAYGSRVRDFLCSLAAKEGIPGAPPGDSAEANPDQAAALAVECLAQIQACCTEHIPTFRERLSAPSASLPLFPPSRANTSSPPTLRPASPDAPALPSSPTTVASNPNPNPNPNPNSPPPLQLAQHGNSSTTSLESSGSSVPEGGSSHRVLSATHYVRPRSFAVGDGSDLAAAPAAVIASNAAREAAPRVVVTEAKMGGHPLRTSSGPSDELLLLSLQMEPPQRPLPALPSPSSNSSSLSVASAVLLPQSTSFVLQTPPLSPHPPDADTPREQQGLVGSDTHGGDGT